MNSSHYQELTLTEELTLTVNIRPRSSQHTADGDAMSGSLATTSMRKPSGSLNAAALCSGVSGPGASFGFGICAETRFARNTAGRINLETTTLRLVLRTQPRSEDGRPFIGRSKAGCRAVDTFCSRHPAPAPNPSSPRDPEA